MLRQTQTLETVRQEESARALRRSSHGGGRRLEDGLSGKPSGKQSLETGRSLDVGLGNLRVMVNGERICLKMKASENWRRGFAVNSFRGFIVKEVCRGVGTEVGRNMSGEKGSLSSLLEGK